MFALVDCNNFYASCERIGDPSIRNKPVVVLSNNDGCIIARSNEAKVLGLKMGQPFFQVAPLLKRHGVAVFSSNYTLYGDMSRRVMDSLQQFSPEVEEYSIDEAFLNLAGFDRPRLAAQAEAIHRTVRQWTAIPVSVGVGRTKTLAKVANRIAKSDPAAGGVCLIESETDRLAALQRTAIGDVWGIGRQYARFLESNGVTTALEFSRLPDAWLRRHLTIAGLRTAVELRGTSCIPLELAPPPKQSVTVSRMFGHRLTSLEQVRQPLIAYTSRAGEKLRREGLAAGHLLVFLANSRFSTAERPFSPSLGQRLPRATSNTAELIQHACSLLARIYRPGFQYAKCGVILTELVPEGSQSRDLFEHAAADPGRNQRLMAALDAVNRRHGRDSLTYAGAGIRRDWAATANRKSRCFTTDSREMITVRA